MVYHQQGKDCYAFNVVAKEIFQFSRFVTTKILNLNVDQSTCFHHQLQLVWVPGHQGRRANEKADEYTVIE